jgi:hypothetical protein
VPNSPSSQNLLPDGISSLDKIFRKKNLGIFFPEERGEKVLFLLISDGDEVLLHRKLGNFLLKPAGFFSSITTLLS